jgi:hypothetical protein
MADLVQLGAIALKMDITREAEVQTAVNRIEKVSIDAPIPTTPTCGIDADCLNCF